MIAFTGFMSTLTLLLRVGGRAISQTIDALQDRRSRPNSSSSSSVVDRLRPSPVHTAATGVKLDRNLGTDQEWSRGG